MATTETRSTYGFSPRQREVLVSLAEGLADKEIAQKLGISYWTVTKHVQAILDKMEVSSRTAAGVRAIRERLV